MTHKEYFEGLKGKKIAVAGVGISNTPLIETLVKYGAVVTACDKKENLGETGEKLKILGVELKLGENYLDDIDADIIFRSPGIRDDVAGLVKAVEKGAVLTSEMEVFFELCPVDIIAVTGSDGKTTTTTLICELLKAQGYTCHLGGNIGKPLLPEIDKIKDGDKVIVELSSFQLKTMKKSPKRGVITNLSPNHLDWHKDYKEYIDSKMNIMSHQNKDGIFVTNFSNVDCRKIISEAKCECRTFSSKEDAYVCLKDGVICCNGEKLLDIKDIKIPGMHNVENYMAAIAVTYPDVSKEAILKVAKEFGGVPHRIELVRVLDGVRYYNSSIDSSPNRTINTLKVFNEPVILISGGKDKGIPYDEIGKPILEKAKALILIGKTTDVIEKAVRKAETECGCEKELHIYRGNTYEEVVNLAKELATSGDVVLLSNASTSFDMFKNFEERGNTFKEIVNGL